MIRVGTAGWSYPDWDGAVYPRHKPTGFHPLPFLARYFDCIEVNSSFYAMPRAEHTERWVRLVADRPDFRFSVKLLQDFTHGPTPGKDTGDWDRKADAFRRAIEPIRRARRLGAILVQTVVSGVTQLGWPTQLGFLFVGIFILVAVGTDLIRERTRRRA